MKKKRILIVEDERIVADDIKMSLERLGYEVCGTAISGEQAVKKKALNSTPKNKKGKKGDSPH